jgi:replicative DNA helicase
LFFSLEMKKEQLAQRLAAKKAKIPLSDLKTGRLSEQQWTNFYEAANDVDDAQLYFCDRFDIDIKDVRDSMRRAIARIRREPGLIIVDHLGLLAGAEEGSADEYQKVTKMSRALKNLAGEFNAPVIALSQLSRGVESRQNKRPMMSDLRQSGSIEQDADFVLLMYRDEYYNKDTQDRSIAEVILAKGRDSETGTVKLLFDGQFMEFKNLRKGEW